MRFYSYDAARRHAEKEGLQWSDAIEDQVNREFAALGLTQSAVDRLIVLHVHYLKYAFAPANYGLWDRLRMAAYWLIGR